MGCPVWQPFERATHAGLLAMTGSERGPMSAAEFMAQLEKDEDYQRKRAAFDAELEERTSVLRAAEQPIVADLLDVGIPVESVWDLVNTTAPYPAALPVLVEHLERGEYPDRVMESLGRALAVQPAVAFWDRLKARYLGQGVQVKRRELPWRWPLARARLSLTT